MNIKEGMTKVGDKVICKFGGRICMCQPDISSHYLNQLRKVEKL
jgi:hypothetical protein